jgi:hypothetical protein
MTITEQVAKNIIRKLLKGEDYRIEIVTLINAEFLQFAIDFFKRIVDAKLKSKNITVDWYKKEFLNPSMPARDIAINAGLNKKTIHNMFNSSTKEIVIDASNEHYDTLYVTIKNLVESEHDLDLTLTIKFKGVSVDLNVSESLIVINTLAVKRAELRGGLWSTAGKRVEKPLMQTLCKLYDVPDNNYAIKIKDRLVQDSDFEREVDFYLVEGKSQYKCEVKLMGRGNPESTDAVIARDSKVFVADKLSETNKRQLDSLGVEWVELRNDKGFQRFEIVLNHLRIPHGKLALNIDQNWKKFLEKSLNKLMPIPDYQSIMLPLLKFAGDKKEHSIREAIEHIANIFNLSEEERREVLPSGQQYIIDNRVGWARTYLKKAGLLESTKRSYFKITDLGLLERWLSGLRQRFAK